MGLLNHITCKEAHNDGLLAKAAKQKNTANPIIFSEWITENELDHVGIFTLLNNTYVLSKCFGIDADSIVLSISSRDFWDGTLQIKNQWKTFSSSENELTVFFQFFSPSIRSSISKIHFFPIDNQNHKDIIMILEFTKNQQLPEVKNIDEFLITPNNRNIFDSAITKGLSFFDGQLFILSVKLAVDTFADNILTTDLNIKNTITNTIIDEIVTTLRFLFTTPNCICKGSDGELKIVLFSHKLSDTTLLQHHIVRVLKPVLGNSISSGILLLPAGITTTVKDTVSFLLQG